MAASVRPIAPPLPPLENRVLVLAPIGRDADVAAKILGRAAIDTLTCGGIDDLCARLVQGAGAVLLTEEALAPRGTERLREALATQPAWSDVPVVVLTSGGLPTPASLRAVARLGERANVILLERPVRSVTLVSALRTALRARRRQYEVRNYLAEGERAAVERARLLADEQAARTAAEEAARRARFLAEASRLFSASLDYETTLRSAAWLSVPFLADWCTIDVIDDDGTIRRVAIAHADPAKADTARRMAAYPPDPSARHPRTRVLRTGAPVLIRDIGARDLGAIAPDPDHRAVLQSVGYRSAMIVPLVARGASLGAITFATAESARRYDAADLALAEEVAQHAALAVDNARLFAAERRARTTAEVASRAKDTFLATVSHELRTPLSPILAWARMLRTGKLEPDRALRALEIIERNARSQAQLIEDLLDVSRIITGKMRLELRPIALAPVVRAALDVVRPAADAKGVGLRAAFEDGIGPVCGDPERLQQVVWNLLSNAVKFTPPGGWVDVSVTRAGADVELVVRDTGQGIAPEFLPFVFERFQQADSSASRVHAGLGLGLAIVRHIVELHGGAVRVASPGEGRGAAFTVSLPVAREAPAAPGPAPDSRMRRTSLAGVRVLVVDDEPDSNEAMTAVLAQSGADVRVAASAAQAVEIMGRWRGDVLLTDIAMPGDDGYALIARVRRRDDRWRDVPAIALTAYASADDRERLLAAGFQRHVAKPVEPADLIGAVADVVARGA